MLAGFCVALVFAAAAAALVDVPVLRGRVNDYAGVLDGAQRQQLEERLAAFEAETSHQVVVLTVPKLDGEDIAAFAIRVAEAWKIGHAKLDNGAILVVAPGDRKARIEVGYGLEGVVPDAIAARILREHMIPHFREGRMAEGIVSGAEMVMRAARGELIPAERRPSRAAEPQDPLGIVMFAGILGGMIGGGLVRRSRVAGALLGGGIAFAIAYMILELMGFAVFSSLIGSTLASLGGAIGGPGGRRIRTLPGVWGGGFGRGGWGGGGGGGWGGGGGFGGGGGGFGGGGASGSW